MKITQWAKRACCGVLICLISIGLASCGGEATPKTEETNEMTTSETALTEVAPPSIFQELRQTLDNYQPQVSILSPKNGTVIEDTRVSIEVDVKDYPLFKNEELGMGPHLHVILDNEPYRAVYTAEEPIVFEDLSPGTHTIRMFASRPWHESFKNEGAYAQRTFHLFTETGDNAPDPEKPLLTYSRPKGSYGAEPILLDYYLTNAPIRLFEQDNDSEVEVNPASQNEWRVRATVNGESFIMDSWLPVYLEGFKQGQNWIKLELLDADGNLIENAFNTAARLVTYQPQGQDTLSKLVRGEISAEKARLIVDPDYQLPAEEEEITEQEEAVTEPEPEQPAEETAPEAVSEPEQEGVAEPEQATPEQPAEETAPEAVSEPKQQQDVEPAQPQETVTEPEEEQSVEETAPEAVTESKEKEEPAEQPQEVISEPEPAEAEDTSSEAVPDEDEETVSQPESEQEITEELEETPPEARAEDKEETASQSETTKPETAEEDQEVTSPSKDKIDTSPDTKPEDTVKEKKAIAQ